MQANEFYTNVKKINGKFQVVGGYFGETFKTLAQVLNFTYVLILTFDTKIECYFYAINADFLLDL